MLNRRRLLLGGSAVAAAAIAGTTFAVRAHWDTRPSAEVIAWLKANAMPLATAEPGSGWHDLEALRARIGDARIVSLGEATHGTREFFQLKHRMIEYCVSELGFTVIGFEAEFGATLAVNDYVLTGKGNAKDAVSGMGFWTWDTEEVVALVEWVRAWNVAHERKVKFYGFDMQSSAAPALHLLAYLQRVSPHLAAVAEQNLSPLVSNATLDDFSCLPAAVQEQTFAQIRTVIDAFTTQRASWVGKTGELEWRLARQSALVVEQFARLNVIDAASSINFVPGFRFRDECMAGHVRALLDAEEPGTKAVLWAHNGHVQKAPTKLAGLVEMTNMGSRLHAAFGPEMVVVGFAFNQGGFQAVGPDSKLVDHVVGAAPDDYLDAALAATGIRLLALDLARVPTGSPVARWMANKPLARSIGSMFNPAWASMYSDAIDPRTRYDVLLFVERTTAARPNKRPRHVSAPGGSNEEPTNLALAGSNEVPDGWRAVSHSLYPYAVTVADEQSPKGGRAAQLARANSPLPWGDGMLTQSFPATPWRGQRVMFSADMCAEARRIGTGARLVIKVWPKVKDGDRSVKPIVVALSDVPVRASRWVRQSVAVDIPRDAERVQISLVVTGDAAGWFGDLKFEKSGGPVMTASAAQPEQPDRSPQLAAAAQAMRWQHLRANMM